MSHRILLTSLSFGVATALLATPAAFAQQPAQAPVITTTKVPNTDNVYVFRYQFHQSMFVVTPDGVIATDPIGSPHRPLSAELCETKFRDCAANALRPPAEADIAAAVRDIGRLEQLADATAWMRPFA